MLSSLSSLVSEVVGCAVVDVFSLLVAVVVLVLVADAVPLSSESVGASDCCRRSIRSAFVLLDD